MRRSLNYLVGFLTIAALLVSCTGNPDDKQYEKSVVLKDNATGSGVQHIFEQYSFPNGVVPVLVVEDSVSDLLKIGARADDLFDEISEEREDDDFEDYGLMVYVTHNPKLIQLRLGSYYELYGDLKGITMGLPYYDIQRAFIEGDADSAMQKMLDIACQVSVERQGMTWMQRTQLSNVKVAINNVLEWFGSPSKNFYGKVVTWPIYTVITSSSKWFGSWIWGVGLIFLLIILARYGIDYFFTRLAITGCVRWIISTSFSFVFSATAAGCALLFSNGRMEDLTAIKAFGIPHIEDFMIDSSFFIHDNNLWTAGAFLVAVIFSMVLTNDYFLDSLLPNHIQRSKWDSLPESVKGSICGLLQIDMIPPTDRTPYVTLANGAMGNQMGPIVAGLAMGALFFFSKALIWVGIAYAIAKILSKLGSYVEVVKVRARYSYMEMPHMVKSLGIATGLAVFMCILSMVLAWWLNPFDTDGNPKEETVAVIKEVEVRVEVANLRIGPGTEYDFARKDGMSEEEHLHALRGQRLGVVEEDGDWYKVLIDGHNHMAYISKKLCNDLIEMSDDAITQDKPMSSRIRNDRETDRTAPISQESAIASVVEEEVAEESPAQPIVDVEETVFDTVDQMPSYPGGMSALMQYLRNNIHYPSVAEENGIQGRVTVVFVVEKDGSISNVRVGKSVNPSLDKEALRVIRAMPRWNPGRRNGEFVRVRYTIPVTFRLQ